MHVDIINLCLWLIEQNHRYVYLIDDMGCETVTSSKTSYPHAVAIILWLNVSPVYCLTSMHKTYTTGGMAIHSLLYEDTIQNVQVHKF